MVAHYRSKTHTMRLGLLLTSSMIKIRYVRGPWKKTIVVVLISATNWWLLPCWPAADTFPTANVKDKIGTVLCITPAVTSFSKLASEGEKKSSNEKVWFPVEVPSHSWHEEGVEKEWGEKRIAPLSCVASDSHSASESLFRNTDG